MGAYVRLSAAYADVAAQARERGWPVREMDATHLSLLTEPARVAEAIVWGLAATSA
jgi:hypothetical protein